MLCFAGWTQVKSTVKVSLQYLRQSQTKSLSLRAIWDFSGAPPLHPCCIIFKSGILVVSIISLQWRHCWCCWGNPPGRGATLACSHNCPATVYPTAAILSIHVQERFARQILKSGSHFLTDAQLNNYGCLVKQFLDKHRECQFIPVYNLFFPGSFTVYQWMHYSCRYRRDADKCSLRDSASCLQQLRICACVVCAACFAVVM